MLKKIIFFQLVIFAAILLTTGGVKAEQKYPLTVKILDADGRAFKDQKDKTEFIAQLWQKVDNDSAVQGTYNHPVVHSPDGSVWRQINLCGFYFQYYPTPDWIVKQDVAVGEYRVTFTVRERLYRQNISDVIKVIAWGISDTIVIGDSKAGKELELRADAGSKVRIRTTFFPDPNEEPKKDDKNPTTSDTKIKEANAIKMRIFREENFPTDQRLYYYWGEGMPSFVDFEQMKPGKYQVHFFRGSPSPETGTTKTTDVFSFEVTKDGKNEFVFTPVKSLAENATWQITGTVRDTNGSPIERCVVSLTDVQIPIMPDYYSGRDTVTDAEGKYRLAVTPFWSQSGTLFDEKDKCLRWGFCVQQANLRAAVIDERFKPEYKRNLIFIGDVAMSTSEEFQKRLAERKEQMILISPDKPVTVDFVLTPEKPLKYNNQKWSQKTWKEHSQRFREKRIAALKQLGMPDDLASHKLFKELTLQYSLNREYKELKAIGSKVSVKLESTKPAFMVGEPVELNVVISNGNERSIIVELDENITEPFSVWSELENGEVLIDGFSGGMMHSGPIRCQLIKPKESFSYNIFLPDRFALPKIGKYTVNVARNLPIQDVTDNNEHWMYDATAITIPVFVSATFEIVPTDKVKMGILIDELNVKIQKRKGYQEADKAVKVLAEIDDERVIPYFVSEIRGNDYGSVSKALHALSKFNNDDAFNAIKKGLTLSDNNLSRSAAYALTKSKHPNALDEMLKQQNHPDYSVRLTIIQAAYKMEKKVALELLRNHFNDPNPSVAKEAKRIYEELTEEE
jgi:hypothetical protein